MRRFLFILVSVLLTFSAYAENPKREFRGAWIHVIGQSQWMNKTPQQQRDYISKQFQLLEEAGCNAVIFQVRPTADALYKSKYEPWSYWLTGKRGKKPSEDWDPLAYAVEEAHKRGMELHAWLNPYRVTSSPKEVLPADHDANTHPERFVKWDGKIFFDPAYQENRDFICLVVEDIVKRYDVDAIHIDDYFYPYPSNGKKFDADDKSYAIFGNGENRDDWRRDNVNKLIAQLHKTIKTTKPWVRFGVSPFGIWRNKGRDPRGSNSNGLQNYDDLFADPLYWAEKGWIDYLAPQLYWPLDLKVAPSRHLARWWNDNANGVDIYIGQDTKRTMDSADPGANSSNELGTKIKLSRELPNVKGNVWWHGYWVTDNYRGVADELKSNYQSTLALAPAYGDLSKRPEPVKGIKFVRENGKLLLEWNRPSLKGKQTETDAVKYVVYEFLPGEDTDNLEFAETIITITPSNRIVLADKNQENAIKGNTYVVTAIDRMNRESKPVKLKL
ncbi:MAG: family 10 glycosylhydrolase [Muribaculaceae bacterium]|nr:family 10 glycosylhydrolase [Muribaculaceae bacterium]